MRPRVLGISCPCEELNRRGKSPLLQPSSSFGRREPPWEEELLVLGTAHGIQSICPGCGKAKRTNVQLGHFFNIGQDENSCPCSWDKETLAKGTLTQPCSAISEESSQQEAQRLIWGPWVLGSSIIHPCSQLSCFGSSLLRAGCVHRSCSQTLVVA